MAPLQREYFRTGDPSGMSQLEKLERWTERHGYRKVGCVETKHGTVFVAEKPVSETVFTKTRKVVWSCRDFLQENEVTYQNDNQLIAVSVNAAERFFDSKDF